MPTFDKDFGELAFHQKLPASCGIILFRIPALIGLCRQPLKFNPFVVDEREGYE